MPEIHPKSPEIIQAQAAAFTAEKIDDPHDRTAVFKRIAGVALNDSIGDVIRTAKHRETLTNEKGQKYRAAEGTQILAATPREYVDFLRSMDNESREKVANRAELLNAYTEFAPIVQNLKAELANHADGRNHSEHLGSGGNSQVFSIEKDGKKYAVRIPLGRDVNPVPIDEKMLGALKGNGVPHLEQIVATSYEDGVTVAEVMPGKEFDEITLQEVEQVTDEQLSEFVNTLVAADKRQIGIDPKPNNFFYDPQEGFGIIDYSSNKRTQNLGMTAPFLSTALRNMGTYGKHYNFHRTKEDYEAYAQMENAKLDVVKRYKHIVGEKLDGEMREVALQGIDKDIQMLQKDVDNYADPEWLANHMASERRRVEKWQQDQAASAERKRLKAEQDESSGGWARKTADEL